MPAAPHTAAPSQLPGPHKDRPPTRTLRLLSLLRTLIAFGQEFANTLRTSPSNFTIFDIACRFSTTDVALILTRITRGLRLAMALETKLEERAARAQPVPAPRSSSPCQPRTKPRAPRQPVARPVLAALPTDEEIAEYLRTRPIHTVIIDICNDLGIRASDPMWRQLGPALIEIDGHIAFFNSVRKRPTPTNLFPPDMPPLEAIQLRMPEHSLTFAAADSTGPP